MPLFHGFFNCINRIFKKTWEKANVVFQWAVTFTIVDLLWLLFRADDLPQAFYLIKKMACLDSFTVSPELISSVTMKEFSFLESTSFAGVFRYAVAGLQYLNNSIYGFNLWVLLLAAFFIVLNLKNTAQIKFSGTILRTIVTVILLVWSMVSFTGVATYIYAGF